MEKEPNSTGRLSSDEAAKLLEEKDAINTQGDSAESRHDAAVKSRIQEINGQMTLSENTPSRADETSKLHSAGDKYWKNMPLEILPSRGWFYPAGFEITFRAAEVGEIRHWSTIDDGDMLDMDTKMNFIMEKCVRVKRSDGTWASWEDIIEIDRFYLLFCIHEITFPNGENKLLVKFKCPPTCKGDGTYKESVHLTSDMLNLLVMPDDLMQYYNPEEKCFVKVSVKLNETLRFYMPTIGVSKKIKNVVRKAQDEGEFVDKAFMRIAPYLVKEWRTLDDKKLEALRMDTLKWGKNKVLFVNGIASLIEKAVNLSVKKECPKCHIELEAPIFFRGGFTIKSLFYISGGIDELI